LAADLPLTGLVWRALDVPALYELISGRRAASVIPL